MRLRSGIAVHRPAAAAPIRPLALELLYATDAAIKKKKDKKVIFDKAKKSVQWNKVIPFNRW